MSLPLTHSIHDGIRSYEGTQLAKPRPCPHYRGSDYRKHDSRPRRFAVLITEDGFEDVTVTIQRYWCKQYEKRVDAEMSERFYEDCLYCKPIVDLWLYHASENLFNRSKRIPHIHYGIQVDRDTIQRYAELFSGRVNDHHGSNSDMILRNRARNATLTTYTHQLKTTISQNVSYIDRVTVADEPLSLNFLSLLFGTETAVEFCE